MPALSPRCPAALGLLAAALLAPSTAPAEDEGTRAAAGRPSVLLITIDTLRPDALGWIAGRNDTPAIDGLARAGFRFPAAATPVPLTLPAHVSIMTALVPRRHGVRDNGQTLGDVPLTLAQVLRSHGYATAAFVSGYPLDHIFGLDRGFEHYDDNLPEGDEGWLERLAYDTTDAALAWVATARKPWFAWIHYYDPHDPYTPPRPFWRPGDRGAYLGEVAYTDSAIERLLASMGPGSSESRLTVFTADHGEALGEHREKRHGYFIYDSTVTVPLVLHWPGHLQPGQSEAAARLLDIAPTILELVGLPALQDVDGQSLVPLLQGRVLETSPAYLETHLPWIYFGWAPLTAVRDQGWKLIAAPRPELYRLEADPGETQNLIDIYPERARELGALLRSLESRAGVTASAIADPQALAQLQALGYVGAGAWDQEPPDGLPDPKDRIELRERLHDAEEAMRQGRFGEALEVFDAVLQAEPGNRCATLRSGVALLKAGRPAEAAHRLQRAVELDPNRAEAHYALADALMRIGEPLRAAVHWREVTRLQPRRPDAWFNLAAACRSGGEPERAIAALETARELDPDDSRVLTDLAATHLELARRELAAGRGEAAAAALAKALELDPGLREKVAADVELGRLLD